MSTGRTLREARRGQRATSSTTFPRLSVAMLRSNAALASSSENTESIAGGGKPPSSSAAISAIDGARIAEITAFLSTEPFERFGLPAALDPQQ
jgi:hypothetical protein